MDTTAIIKKLLIDKKSSTPELSHKLGCSQQNLYNKYKRNNFSVNELEEIANAVGCNLVISFTDKD